MASFIEFEGHKISIGDVFVSSWGCEQTNVNFYQVVAVSGKMTVKIREIESQTINDGAQSFTGKKYARLDRFKNEVVLTRRLLRGYDEPTLNDDHTIMSKSNPFKGHRFSSYA
ncbi:hypothetical protein AB0001_004778 [Salmonella enterica]|nr:hypothetical protein [Salmonella enterica]EEP3373014.1 hypothetical protein [Salmonella enterica]EFP6579721.1 hypothetical protein [Salmonella enterica]EGC7971004.1 hypothetical protein [Salmonella enterica]EIV4461181.1 hypothetical protein [Salmonella enterica]